MSLEFLGRQPNDLTEYRCTKCKAEFDFRAANWKTRKDYLEPKFCPNCASPALPEKP